jgi:hypothetical protein
MPCRSLLAAPLSAACVLAGCAAAPPAPAPRPARISHLVLVKLRDPAQGSALIADCDRLLADIPSVVAYAAGRHLETGRDNVESGYDVGLYLGFDTEEGYTRYIEHPHHQEILRLWEPSVEWLRVYDVVDDGP